jgi:release factor glutamine methyltransferase
MAYPRRKADGMDRAPTVIEAVRMSEGYLARHGVESPRLSAEHLLARALGCTRLDLYLRFEETLGEPVLARYRGDLKKRASRIPLQYILGEVEFRSLTLRIEEDVFIPRPETELLVEFAAELMNGRETVRFIEFGTGSGAISGALASMGPGWTGVAFDISPCAVELAAANIEAIGLSDRVEVRISDGFGEFSGTGEFDLVISNPPYIPAGEIDGLQEEVSSRESRSALDGGVDGLDFYPVIAREARRLLRPGGVVAVEIGHGQGEAVREIFRETGYLDVEMRKDYNGLERMVAGKRGD